MYFFASIFIVHFAHLDNNPRASFKYTIHKAICVVCIPHSTVTERERERAEISTPFSVRGRHQRASPGPPVAGILRWCVCCAHSHPAIFVHIIFIVAPFSDDDNAVAKTTPQQHGASRNHYLSLKNASNVGRVRDTPKNPPPYLLSAKQVTCTEIGVRSCVDMALITCCAHLSGSTSSKSSYLSLS